MKSINYEKERLKSYTKILQKYGYPKMEKLDILEAIENVKNLGRVILDFERRNKKTSWSQRS